MDSDPAPLILPLGFSPFIPLNEAGCRGQDLGGSDLLSSACSTATPSVLISWPAKPPGNLAVAVGCDDGTIFLLYSQRGSEPQALQAPAVSDLRSIPQRKRQSTSSSSRITRIPSPAPSRSSHRSSITLSQPPTLVQPRASISSSLSRAQVEAPKNFVDYDDEQDKLRSILKTNSTGSTTNRKATTSLEIPLAKSPSPGSSAPTSAMDDDEDRPPSRTSINHNTTSTPTALTFPPLPTSNPFKNVPYGFPDVTLKLHIVPPRIGFGHSITSIKVIEGGQLIACLQESGSLSLFHTSDGVCLVSCRLDEYPRIKPPTGCKALPGTPGLYRWSNMRVAQDGESTLLFLTARVVSETAIYGTGDGQSSNTPQSSLTRVTLIRARSAQERDLISSPDEILEQVGDWIEDAPVMSIGLHADASGDLAMYLLTPSSHLVLRSFHFLPDPPTPTQGNAELPSNNPTNFLPQSLSLPQIQLNLPNPFKSADGAFSVRHRRNKSYHMRPNLPISENVDGNDILPGRIEFGAERDLGVVALSSSEEYVDSAEVAGLSLTRYGDAIMGCLWSVVSATVFRVTGENTTTILTTIPSDAIRSVTWLDEWTIMVFGEVSGIAYSLLTTPATPDKSPPGIEGIPNNATPALTVPLPTSATPPFLLSPSSLLVVKSALPHRLSLECISFSVSSYDKKPQRTKPATHIDSRTLWEPPDQLTDLLQGRKQNLLATSAFPLTDDTIIIGFSDGIIGKASLKYLLYRTFTENAALVRSTSGLDYPITSLNYVKNFRTKESFVIGSASDGSLAAWNTVTLALCARWTLFATPLLTVVDLSEEKDVGRLTNCILCVAEHGTIAVIAIDGLELQYLIPGSSSPLERICIGGENLLLIYSDAKARLWDVKSQEFWRSMSREKADDLLDQGGWYEVEVEQEGPRFIFTNKLYGLVRRSSSSSDAGTTLYTDIRGTIESARSPTSIPPSKRIGRSTPPLASPQKHGEGLQLATPLVQVKIVLSALVPSGLDGDIDRLRDNLLGIPTSSFRSPVTGHTGFRGSSSTVLLSRGVADMWKVSSDATALWLMQTVALLRTMMAYEEFESTASQLIIMYTTSLAEIVGPGYQTPSLQVLGRYWFDPNGEVKQAARTIFNSVVQQMSDEEALRVIENYRHRLPSIQPDAQKEASYAALALLVIGHLAVENYTLLPTTTLTDIAKSITLYLHDDASAHRVIAIELCSAGFHIWQHYVDAMEVLRALFVLATSSKKDAAVQGASSQARSAILQIASSNVPLFMTTLSLDILHPSSTEYRKSIMQLVAFIIRKKPLVLYPNLPRLVEAVVKSLDPNSSSSREAVLDPAVEILSHVVRTFPTVDFHKATQRLAVGTNEGAIVMYDLKTATRLYVLEGHKKRLSACSFSPDGRRLVTASLEESVVMVWKVGSSLASFFNPGVPPRQGGAGESEAYRKLDFNVGTEAHMTVASTLDWVAFEWPSERTARLKIRDSVLTFAT